MLTKKFSLSVRRCVGVCRLSDRIAAAAAVFSRVDSVKVKQRFTVDWLMEKLADDATRNFPDSRAQI